MNKRIKIKLWKYPKGKKFWLFKMKGKMEKGKYSIHRFYLVQNRFQHRQESSILTGKKHKWKKNRQKIRG